MRVEIQGALEDYLHEQKCDTISLELIQNTDNFTWFRRKNTMRPSIHYSKPDKTSNFDKYTVDDFTVYVDKEVQCKHDKLEFVQSSRGNAETCNVKGVRLRRMR